jgi:hypothetical protein
VRKLSERGVGGLNEGFKGKGYAKNQVNSEATSYVIKWLTTRSPSQFLGLVLSLYLFPSFTSQSSKLGEIGINFPLLQRRPRVTPASASSSSARRTALAEMDRALGDTFALTLVKERTLLVVRGHVRSIVDAFIAGGEEGEGKC